jgi:hypothetical protein
MPKEYKHLTLEKLKSYPELKHLTDEEGEEAIAGLEQFSIIAYKWYTRLCELGIADENGAIPSDWENHPALLADVDRERKEGLERDLNNKRRKESASRAKSSRLRGEKTAKQPSGAAKLCNAVPVSDILPHTYNETLPKQKN